MRERPEVLIVDDDDYFRRILLLHLDARGYDTVQAADGEQAVALTLERRPDVVLLDILMPKRDGWDALAEIRATPEVANTPVVMISGVPGADRDPRADTLKPDAFLVKPFGPLTLIDTLSKLVKPPAGS